MWKVHIKLNISFITHIQQIIEQRSPSTSAFSLRFYISSFSSTLILQLSTSFPSVLSYLVLPLSPFLSFFLSSSIKIKPMLWRSLALCHIKLHITYLKSPSFKTEDDYVVSRCLLLMWRIRLLLSLDRNGQKGQEYGFSPLWIRRCFWRLVLTVAR